MEMFGKLIFFVVIAAATLNVIQGFVLVRNVSYESDDILQDTINTINKSLNEHYWRIKSYTLDALNNPLIVNVDDNVSILLSGHNATLIDLETMMSGKNEEAVGLGEEYVGCAQVEEAEGILKDTREGMQQCTVAVDDFLNDYDEQMVDFVDTTESVSQYAYDKVFACVPEGDELTDEEVEAAVNCMNYEQLNSHHSLNLLEQMLVSIQYNYEFNADVVYSDTSGCLVQEIEEGTSLSSNLVNEVDLCISQTKVMRNEVDLEETLIWANMSLEKSFEYITEKVEVEMENDEISEAIADIERKVASANTTVIQLGESMFIAIDEAAAVPVHEHCTIGMTERAQNILDQAYSVLPNCGGRLYILAQEYEEDLENLMIDIEANAQRAEEHVGSCVPPGELTEEQSAEAIACVQFEVMRALQSNRVFDEMLQDIVREMDHDVNEFTLDAKNCIQRVQNVAGDQYGAFQYTLETCIKDSLTSTPGTATSTMEPRFNPRETKTTVDDLQEAIDRANTTLTNQYARILNVVTSELENEEIAVAIAEVAERVTAVNQSVINMVEMMFRKIDEAEAVPAYQHCTVGLREKAQNVQNQANSNLQHCDGRLNYLDMEHQDSLGIILTDLQASARSAAENVSMCLPTNNEPTEAELVAAISCVDSAAIESQASFTFLEESLKTLIENTNIEFEDLKYEARRCVETAQHVSGDQTGYLLSMLDQCISSSLTSTNPSTTTGAREDLPPNMEDVEEAVESANATFRERFVRIAELTESALNNVVIRKAVGDTDFLVESSETSIDDLGLSMEEKITEAERNNLTECSIGQRIEALRILQNGDDAINECALPVYNVAVVYDKQMGYFLQRAKEDEQKVYENVVNCVPTSTEPSVEEIGAALLCITRKTTSGIYTIDILEQMLVSMVERGNYQAVEFHEQAVPCAHEAVLMTSDKAQILIQLIEDCIMNSFEQTTKE